MYTSYYGFREKPFALSPDPRFLYLSASHREVLGHLVYGIEQGEGFMAITGEVGTGKTTLCRTLLRRLGSESEVAFLFNPTLGPLELLKAVNAEFGLSTFGDSRPELTDVLNQFLLDRSAEGRRVLLIVDEAQNLATDTLEQLRLLSNLETERSKLLQIVLLGQPELDQKLAERELRQLRQRISVWWRLTPLDADETREYVRHRLRIAGALDRPIFTDGALSAVHRLSGGVPRVINLICDRALLAGYAEQCAQIGRRQVLGASRELQPRARRHWRRAGAGAALAASLLAAAAGFAWVAGDGLWRAAEPALPAAVAAAPDPGPTITHVTVAPEPEPAPSEAAFEPIVPPAPIVAEGPLELLLGLHSPDETRAATLEAALAAWQLPPHGAPELELGEFLERLRRVELELLPVAPELRALQEVALPAVVSLREGAEPARTALLRRLDPDAAELEGVVVGQTLRVTTDDLLNHLEGAAFAVWRNFESLPPTIAAGDRGDPVAWLQRALTDLGYYGGDVNGEFDTNTEQAVSRFQNDQGLASDGRVGPRTQMRLYDALPHYATPTLFAEPVDFANAS